MMRSRSCSRRRQIARDEGGLQDRLRSSSTGAAAPRVREADARIQSSLVRQVWRRHVGSRSRGMLGDQDSASNATMMPRDILGSPPTQGSIVPYVLGLRRAAFVMM
eukprot:3114883-Amphidinium_carterae.1